MKKLTLTFFAAVLIALTSPFANGQNNIWSLPPYYYNHDLGTYDSLPQNDYLGEESEYCHNAMQDKDGNLLFFIVDGRVFDKEGYLIGDMTHSGGGTTYEIFGSTEILIVPYPADCDKYYLFADGDPIPGHSFTTETWYTILDFTPDSQSPGPYFPEISTPQILSTNVKNYYNSLGATKINNNKRFIFQINQDRIYKYILDNTGLNLDSVYHHGNSSYIYTDGLLRAEMEIIETLDTASQPIYRIAYAYVGTSNRYIIYLAELDINNANVISGTEEFIVYQSSGGQDPLINGLEFSPDGQTLYITHEITTSHSSGIDYYVVGSGNPTQSLGIATDDDFQFSQIETGLDGKLYLATSDRLATIDQPNAPTTTNFTDTAIVITYSDNYAYTIVSGGSPYGTPLYLLPDQIDEMNYATHFTADLECCIAHTTFTTGTDSTNHEQSGTQSWTTSSNPFNNLDTITVKDELIIKSGANITATNLRFEFAPNAKLTIEEGAIFTISGCTLTVNTECDTNAMWIGVDVLGVDTGQQTGSGKLIASSSLIEHSYIGVHNYKTVAGTRNEDYGYRGGIIQAGGTIFRNNHRGTVYFDYQNVNGSGSPINDLSYFNNCTFITDAQLNQDTLTPTVIMAHLFDVQGVNFYGCDFKNTANTTTIPYIDRGLGISAHNCLLTVTRKCSPDVYCNTPDRGNFTDLLRGIESTSTSTRTTEVSYTNFTNNWRDIYLETVDLATIIENNINVGADSYWGSSYGLYLNECDGYTVENNAFTTNTTTQNGYVGVYVLNSDTNNNEVYRNTFDKFYIGSQAAEVNGNGVFGSGSKGLIFRCNTYTNGRDHDILISSGIVNQTHGTCTNATTPSNNRFSYTTQYGDFWHVDTTKNISYQFSQPNGYNLAPRDYMAPPPNPTHYNGVNTFPTICGSYNFNPSTGCPDRINTGGGSESFSGGENTEGLMEEMEAYQGIVEELEEELTKIDNNDAEALKAQQETIAHYKNEAEKTKNNIIRYYLLNQQLEERFSEIEPLLENETNPHKPMRFYLAARKYNKAQELLNELSSQKAYAAFNKLYSSLLELEQSSNFEEELKTNTSLLQNITELAEISENTYEKAIARTLLKRAGLRNDLETIEILNISSARLMNQSEEDKTQNSALTQNTITVYPNPTSGEVNITHNLSFEKGKVMFKVYNMLGTEVLNENLTSTNNEVKINNLKSGVYFYTVTQNNQTIKTDKLMVR